MKLESKLAVVGAKQWLILRGGNPWTSGSVGKRHQWRHGDRVISGSLVLSLFRKYFTSMIPPISFEIRVHSLELVKYIVSGWETTDIIDTRCLTSSLKEDCKNRCVKYPPTYWLYSESLALATWFVPFRSKTVRVFSKELDKTRRNSST